MGAASFSFPGCGTCISIDFEWMVPLFIPNGVTGARVPRGAPQTPSVSTIRSRFADDRRAGPLIVASGPVLDGATVGPPGRERPWWRVANAQEGREAVRRSLDEGAQFIKVYNWLR